MRHEVRCPGTRGSIASVIARPQTGPMITDATRRGLAGLLDGGGAHMTFLEAVSDFPDDAINAMPPNVPYTPWHLVEHVRLTQRDMLDYVTSADYPRMDWPADYWPAR